MALAATASGPLMEGLPEPVNEYVLSQAFWYGVWAAIIYFCVASLMVVTFWGALSGRYPKDFDLVPSQRTLMLQTIMFLMYLLLGALVFSNIEGWDYLDAVYWADVTLFTVGFGDVAPKSHLGRSLLIPYALIGIISLGLVISSIRSMILERGRQRLGARLEEKNRRRMIRTITKKGRDDILTPLEREATNDTMETDVPPGEFERRRFEFTLMRKIQKRAASRRRWMAMGLSTGTWLILWFVGAAIFQKCEESYQGWTYFEAVYFCFVSLLTIGYGDPAPVSNAGKSFFVFWSLMALPTMTVLISNAGDTVVKVIRDATISLGNITILPGEEGFMRNVKHVAHQLTFGHAFSSAGEFVDDVERNDQPSDKSSPSTSKGKEEESITNGTAQSIQTGSQGAKHLDLAGASSSRPLAGAARLSLLSAIGSTTFPPAMTSTSSSSPRSRSSASTCTSLSHGIIRLRSGRGISALSVRTSATPIRTARRGATSTSIRSTGTRTGTERGTGTEHETIHNTVSPMSTQRRRTWRGSTNTRRRMRTATSTTI